VIAGDLNGVCISGKSLHDVLGYLKANGIIDFDSLIITIVITVVDLVDVAVFVL
jgi:hypothetical protein